MRRFLLRMLKLLPLTACLNFRRIWRRTSTMILTLHLVEPQWPATEVPQDEVSIINIIVDVLLHILLKFRQPFLLRMLKLLPLTACRVRQRSQYHPLLDGFLWIIAGPVAAVSFLPPVLIHLGGLGRAMVEYEEMSKRCYSTTMSFSSPRTQPSLELLNNVE